MAIPRTEKRVTNPVFDFIGDFNLIIFSITFLYQQFSDVFKGCKKVTLNING